MTNRMSLNFLDSDAAKVAKQLIGWRLYVREENGKLTGGTIIETEAYRQDDLASHSYKGVTPRTKVMFGPAGFVYVYFTYGMHWCMNIVTGPETSGQAVLLRAIVPEEGIENMRSRRGNVEDKNLTNGPAKVCQALAITGKDSGLQLNSSRILLKQPDKDKRFNIITTPRIGIKQDTHRLWRFMVN